MVVAVAGAAALIIGLRLVADGGPRGSRPGFVLALVGAGAVAVASGAVPDPVRSQRPARPGPPRAGDDGVDESTRSGAERWWGRGAWATVAGGRRGVGTIVGAAAVVLSATRVVDARPRGTWDVTLLWGFGVAVLLVASGAAAMASAWCRAGAARRRARRERGERWTPSGPAIAAIVVLGVAAAARLVALDRFPTVLDSDEGFLVLVARQARLGHLPNPYRTSFLSTPEPYRAFQGIVTRPLADAIASYRLTSALVGLTSVVATWRLGRRLLGDAAGLAAAAILALLPLHLWASRSGLNNITDAAVLVLVLLFTVRAVESGRSADALVAGLVAGLGMGGYYGGRCIWAVAVVWLGLAVVHPGTRVPLRTAARLVGWTVLGTFAGAAPLLGYWAREPDDFTSRFRTVGDLGHTPSLLERLGAVPSGILRPVLDQGSGFFRHPAPGVGWIVAVTLLVGLAAWVGWSARSCRARGRPTAEPLLLAWVVLGAVLAQTQGQASQRFVAITPIWALAAGTGAVVAVRALGRLVPRAAPTWWVAVVVAATVLAAGVQNARFWFSEDRQLTTYSDPSTMAAYDLGWRLGGVAAPPEVLILGSKAFGYQGYGNFRFLAPRLEGHVEEPADLPSDLGGPPGATTMPAVDAGTLTVLPAAHGEAAACAVAARLPARAVVLAVDRRGTRLYWAFLDGPTAIRPEPTPAGTRWVMGATLACPGP